tara:strand:- start:448 stop:579 length:132 start_codon:yes stop_codon:yes gene_type:complete
MVCPLLGVIKMKCLHLIAEKSFSPGEASAKGSEDVLNLLQASA